MTSKEKVTWDLNFESTPYSKKGFFGKAIMQNAMNEVEGFQLKEDDYVNDYINDICKDPDNLNGVEFELKYKNDDSIEEIIEDKSFTSASPLQSPTSTNQSTYISIEDYNECLSYGKGAFEEWKKVEKEKENLISIVNDLNSKVDNLNNKLKVNFETLTLADLNILELSREIEEKNKYLKLIEDKIKKEIEIKRERDKEYNDSVSNLQKLVLEKDEMIKKLKIDCELYKKQHQVFILEDDDEEVGKEKMEIKPTIDKKEVANLNGEEGEREVDRLKMTLESRVNELKRNKEEFNEILNLYTHIKKENTLLRTEIETMKYNYNNNSHNDVSLSEEIDEVNEKEKIKQELQIITLWAEDAYVTLKEEREQCEKIFKENEELKEINNFLKVELKKEKGLRESEKEAREKEKEMEKRKIERSHIDSKEREREQKMVKEKKEKVTDNLSIKEKVIIEKKAKEIVNVEIEEVLHKEEKVKKERKEIKLTNVNCNR